MKRFVRRTASAMIAGTVLMSMTGCSAIREVIDTSKADPEKDVMEVVETYCDALADQDVDVLAELSSDDKFEENKDDLEETFDFKHNDTYSSDVATILETIAGTIEYEIDEDSLKVNEDKGTAEVDVKFTVADYTASYDTTDIDELVDMIEDGATTEYDLTIELEQTDDGWLIENSEDVFDEVYDFMIIAALAPDATIVGSDEPDTYDEPDTNVDTSSSSGSSVADTSSTDDLLLGSATYIGLVDIDYDAHTARAYTNQESFGFYQAHTSSDVELDFTGYSVVIEHDGAVYETVNDDICAYVYADSTGLIEAGVYTFTFYNPAGVEYDFYTVTVD